MGFYRPGISQAQLRGDPGFFGFLGGIAKKALGVAGTVLPGPAGIAARGIGQLVGGSKRRQATMARRGGFQTTAGAQVRFQVPPFTSRPAIAGRFGTATTIAQTGAAGALPPGPMGQCPKGHRLNKSDYFLRDGTFVPAQSRCVKIRRTNPGNARALRRSLRRTESFAGLVKRTRRVTRKLKTI